MALGSMPRGGVLLVPCSDGACGLGVAGVLLDERDTGWTREDGSEDGRPDQGRGGEDPWRRSFIQWPWRHSCSDEVQREREIVREIKGEGEKTIGEEGKERCSLVVVQGRPRGGWNR